MAKGLNSLENRQDGYSAAVPQAPGFHQLSQLPAEQSWKRGAAQTAASKWGYAGENLHFTESSAFSFGLWIYLGDQTLCLVIRRNQSDKDDGRIVLKDNTCQMLLAALAKPPDCQFVSSSLGPEIELS